MSVKYCLLVPVFRFWQKLTHPAARSLCDSWASCYCVLSFIAWMQRINVSIERLIKLPGMHVVCHQNRTLPVIKHVSSYTGTLLSVQQLSTCARAFASTLHTATGEAYDRHLSVKGLSVLHSCHNDVSRGLIVYISCVRSSERPTTCIWCKLGQVTRFSLLCDQPWRDGMYVGLLVVVSN